jgi:hypothetical protein
VQERLQVMLQFSHKLQGNYQFMAHTHRPGLLQRLSVLAVRSRLGPSRQPFICPTAAGRPLPFPRPLHSSFLRPGFIHRRVRGGGKMVQRLTYRKRHSYVTKSNQTRVVKTPGLDTLILSLFPPFLVIP